MDEILKQYAGLLLRLFEYYVAVFSDPWLYWCVVPAVFYMVFFFAKWMVLTAPLWFPVAICVKAIRN